MNFSSCFILLINFLVVNSSFSKSKEGLPESPQVPSIDVSKIGKIDDELQCYVKRANQEQTLLGVLEKMRPTCNGHQKFQSCPVKKVYLGNRKDFLKDDYFIIAKVNSDIITNTDIMNSIRFIFFSSGKPFDKQNAALMIKSILAREIYNKLQEQVAKRNGMRISEFDVNKRVEDIAKTNGISIKELEERFEQLGISMPVFKANIASRMLFSSIVEAMKNDVEITKNEIDEEKKQTIEANKNTRYKLYEIHLRIQDSKHKDDVIKNAKMIIKLVDEGFSFPVLAESISQGNYKLQVGDLGWVSEQNMEKSIKNAVKTLKKGKHTGIVETNSGLKIIFLEDKAEPNKVGSSEAIYKYMKTSLQYKGGIITSKDTQKIDKTIETMKTAKNPENFKKVCKKYNLEIEEKEENITNPFMIEVIESSISGANTMQSLESDDYVDIYYTENKTIPDAAIPTDQEIEYTIISKKVAKLFQRNFKQAENVAFIEINDNYINRLTKERTQ